MLLSFSSKVKEVGLLTGGVVVIVCEVVVFSCGENFFSNALTRLLKENNFIIIKTINTVIRRESTLQSIAANQKASMPKEIMISKST